jgi:hypothetical protein
VGKLGEEFLKTALVKGFVVKLMKSINGLLIEVLVFYNVLSFSTFGINPIHYVPFVACRAHNEFENGSLSIHPASLGIRAARASKDNAPFPPFIHQTSQTTHSREPDRAKDDGDETQICFFTISKCIFFMQHRDRRKLKKNHVGLVFAAITRKTKQKVP